MAKYRLTKGRDGKFSLQAELKSGKQIIHREAIKGLAWDEVQKEVERLAANVRSAREKAGLAGGGAENAGGGG